MVSVCVIFASANMNLQNDSSYVAISLHKSNLAQLNVIRSKNTCFLCLPYNNYTITFPHKQFGYCQL